MIDTIPWTTAVYRPLDSQSPTFYRLWLSYMNLSEHCLSNPISKEYILLHPGPLFVRDEYEKVTHKLQKDLGTLLAWYCLYWTACKMYHNLTLPSLMTRWKVLFITLTFFASNVLFDVSGDTLFLSGLSILIYSSSTTLLSFVLSLFSQINLSHHFVCISAIVALTGGKVLSRISLNHLTQKKKIYITDYKTLYVNLKKEQSIQEKELSTLRRKKQDTIVLLQQRCENLEKRLAEQQAPPPIMHDLSLAEATKEELMEYAKGHISSLMETKQWNSIQQIIEKHLTNPKEKKALLDPLQALRSTHHPVLSKKQISALHPDKFSSYQPIIQAIATALFNLVISEEEEAKRQYQSMSWLQKKSLIQQEQALFQSRLQTVLIKVIEIIEKGNRAKLKKEDEELIRNLPQTPHLSPHFQTMASLIVNDIFSHCA